VESSVLTLSRFILLDPILLLFIMASIWAKIQFLGQRGAPFSRTWWAWLCTTGAFLGCALSCKFVGAFTFLFVGVITVRGVLMGSWLSVNPHCILHPVGL
jgi:dolichyl-phosphate-mannose-protein mannosyltransferase